jgi:hypothetical protein
MYDPLQPSQANPLMPPMPMMPSEDGGIPIDALAPQSIEDSESQEVQEAPHYEPEPARKKLVNRWTSLVQSAKKKHEGAFKRMRDDLKFLAGKQWSESSEESRYQANIVQRHIAQRVAALYAKNPVIKCKRRDTIDFEKWEGTLNEANMMAGVMQQGAAVGVPPDPMVLEMMSDIKQGYEKRRLLDRVAKTMEIVCKHTLDEQLPPFKTQMKQLTRRTCATGVGYAKLGVQRFLKKRPEDIEKITDITQRIIEIERLRSQIEDDKNQMSTLDAEAEHLRVSLGALQAAPEIVVREGIVVDFPKSTSIIVDPRCTYLRGFLGAKWIAHEFIMSVDDVQEIYGVDLEKGRFTAYQNPETQRFKIEHGDEDSSKQPDQVCVWEIYSKTDGLVYTVAEGYCNFLEEPREPHIQLERFWPFFVLAFNEIESECEVFPISDVQLLRPMQLEYNRLREGLREHRFANRPLTAIPDGVLDPEDKYKLESRPANGVVTLKGLQPGQKVGELLQPVDGPRIDQSLYDTTPIFEDVLRVVGTQEANLGGTGGGTATESSIAESSRMSALASNVDDLDDFLNELARAMGQALFQQMSAETVKKIAGVGAVWPELSAQEISNELFLEVQSGSSGRPNKAAEIANIEKIVPLLLQIPGIAPEWLAKELIRRMDDKLDVTDALGGPLQSIVAMNAQKQIATGNPATDPNMQGAQGANNSPSGPQAPQDNQMPAAGQIPPPMPMG